MAINWARGLNKALRIMGNQWATTVNGEPLEFNGIFNTVSGYQETQNGGAQQLITVTTLTLRTDIATQFLFNQLVQDDCGTVWYATQKVMQDDGLVTEVKLVEQPE